LLLPLFDYMIVNLYPLNGQMYLFLLIAIKIKCLTTSIRENSLLCHYNSIYNKIGKIVVKAVPNPVKQMSKTILRHTLIKNFVINTVIVTAGIIEP
jgi:hypothetical protein